MHETTDILVAGGGVMGLWAALRAAEAGLSTTLVEAGTIGCGASGGLLGALFPWMPDRWSDKKQYQFDALVSLPDEIAALEALTGLSANFRRVGRVIPLPQPHLAAIARRHERDAAANWHADGHRFHWSVRDGMPDGMGLDPTRCAAGHVFDTLAARVEPRALVGLLHAALMRMPGVRIIEQAALTALDPVRGRAEIAAGGGAEPGSIAFSHVVIAAGAASFPLLETLLPPLPAPLGRGVKGQAALLRADLDPESPVVFLDGLYVVPHANGFAAIGSTSEDSYADPMGTDARLDAVIDRARALMPALGQAEVVERWAGIRPKAVGRDPMVGPLPGSLSGPLSGHSNVIALTGGFKITFGLAHRLARSALDAVLGTAEAPLPPGFTVEGQLAAEFGA